MKCGNCGFPSVETTITTIEEWDDEELIVFQDVPVEKCPQCGEEYFAPAVLQQLESLMTRRHSYPELEPAEVLQVPVFKYILT